jgi:tetrahydromethanopterin S-methyltransferase subunit C
VHVLGADVGAVVGAVVGPVVGVVVGALVGVVLPVQVTPFTAKLVGAGLLLVHDPLKPNETVPFVGTAPL